ncbi:MAG TPA: sigma-70 family RNA polymerase sigma factor [Bacteroidetes bacterium]|nr:sigma-70 family RNA polymerase sigma factor [Bacteroidota bacterium]
MPKGILHLNATASYTDTELIALAQEGNSPAFREIVNRHQGKVAGVIYGMLGQGMEAEDVGQETFIRFYRSLGDFRGAASLGTYLTRIAINLSLNALKQRKRNFRNVDLESVAFPKCAPSAAMKPRNAAKPASSYTKHSPKWNRNFGP